MEGEVRRLILEYGVKNVMESVKNITKALYEELKDVYGEAVEDEEAPQVETKERKRIVKKAPVEVPTEIPGEASEPVASKEKVVEVVTLRVKKKVAPPVEVEQGEGSDSDGRVAVEGGYPVKSAEQIKKERDEHRTAVEKKRKEIEGQGIEPESLLTKENLEKWLGSGMSYQRIAKELTGCHEADISRYAKRFGLKSQIAAIMVRKHRGY